MSRTITIGRGRSGELMARLFAVVLAGSVLGGCTPTAYTVKETVSYPNDYRKRHQIGISRRIAHGRGLHRPEPRVADADAARRGAGLRESLEG